MFDSDFYEEIWATITRNKWRSFMTAMGVYWGIYMLSIMLGAGFGLERSLKGELDGFATNSAFFYTNSTQLPYKGFKANRYWEMKNDDISIIKREVGGIYAISGLIYGSSPNVSYNDKKGNYSLQGLMPDYYKISPVNLMFGRTINQIDMDQKRKVCVLGDRVYNELFGDGVDPCGQLLNVGGSFFRVVGVIKSNDAISIGSDPASTIILPFTTIQQLYNMGDNFHLLAVAGNDDADIVPMSNEIEMIVKSRHNISPDDTKAIGGFNLKEQFDIFANLFLGINILTWIVGIGTLTAGVVGVSNIMLVVVRERTQEIGVRRALGASPRAIVTQILSESFALTFLAGMFGLVVGVVTLSAADALIGDSMGDHFSAQVTFGTAMISMIILVAGGLLAGIIPATRALGVSAVMAIREE